jgi:hypothetical protein
MFPNCNHDQIDDTTEIRKPGDGLTYQKLQNYFEAETPTTQLEPTQGVKPTQLPLNPGYQAIWTLSTKFKRLCKYNRKRIGRRCMHDNALRRIDGTGNAGWHLSTVDGRRWTSVENSRVFENGGRTFWCRDFWKLSRSRSKNCPELSRTLCNFKSHRTYGSTLPLRSRTQQVT